MVKKELIFPLSFARFFSQNFHPLHTCTHISPSRLSRWLALVLLPSWLISSLQPEQAQAVLGHWCLNTSFHSEIMDPLFCLCTDHWLPAGSLASFLIAFLLRSQLAFSSLHEYMKRAPHSVYLPLLGPLSEVGVLQVCSQFHPLTSCKHPLLLC